MFPDFLVIGGQKCGTSWLQDNLSTHPQVWLPPTKEVHYFDKGNDLLPRRMFGMTKRMKKARAHAAQEFRRWLAGGGASGLKWALNYWLAPRDDEWYARLFPQQEGKIAGEICPGYALMRGAQVDHVATLMPGVKVIYLLRNPVERSWSYAAQYFSSPRRKGHYGAADRVPDAILKEFLTEDAKGHSDYLNALAAWQARFPASQIMVGYFDDLEADPRGLFVRVLEFLGLDAGSASIPPAIDENRRASRGSKAPMDYRVFLARLHLEQLQALHERLGSEWTRRWLDDALALTSDHRPSLAAPDR